jgi:hypothetical protein
MQKISVKVQTFGSIDSDDDLAWDTLVRARRVDGGAVLDPLCIAGPEGRPSPSIWLVLVLYRKRE